MSPAPASEDEIAFAGVAGQAQLLAAGDVTATDLVELALARIDRLQPRLNAFRSVFAEEARQAAADADVARGRGDTRPLLGVPIAVKDNVHVRGHAALFGTGSAEREATSDDELVRRLRDAGLVIVGQTQLPELALWAATESRWHGVTRNPWDTTRAPGGSSGGSAVAVAAGIVPAAHATDGLGSIRIPSSSCGLVGLKATHGLVPMGPDPDHWRGLSHAGFVTRSVLDTAMLLDVAVGGGYTDAMAERPRLRIAASAAAPPWRPDARVRTVFESTLESLRGLGHTVVDRDPPIRTSVANANTVRYLRGVADDVATLEQPERIEPRTRALARLGRRLPGRTVAWARREGESLRGRMAEFFLDTDVLVTPTVARLPIQAGSLVGRGMLSTLKVMLPYAAFTQPWNACGLPAMNVPAGMSDGLPVGVQLVGPMGSEQRLLALAAELEEALDWTARRPPLS